MRTEIRADRIILKAYEESFIPMLFEAARESSADAEFRRWMPWCRQSYTIAESRDFIEKTAAAWKNQTDVWAEGTELGYAIFDAATGRFLGGIGLNQPNAAHKFFNLGYWVRVSEQKRGIAGAATRALAEAAFADLPELNRIEILTAVENLASRKTAAKAGALREGVLRKRLSIGGRQHDAVMFSFVRTDFF